METNLDFKKYLKSKNINNSYLSYYSQSISSMDDIFLQPQTDIFTKLLSDRIIIISGVIDTYLAEYVKANLLYLESLDRKEDITLYINSPGGSVYDGFGILDIMDYIKPDVNTINTGLAASMAAVILCYGKSGGRKSLKRSRTMIHQPIGFGDVSQASDIEIQAKEINEVKKELYEIISKKTGQSYDRVYKDGDRDYWMSSEEAKNYGMIDKIIKSRN
jgi:ATP-dependent Clp protease protease subunit